ncbi:MAG: hypothetical protein JW785_05590 [Acidimicrobiia bacterium]|nr:hypothetical protein [Acidimicrobiia bacterium]
MEVAYADGTASTIEGTCVVTHVGGANGTINIEWPLAFPGETCTIGVAMTNSAFSNTAAVLDGFQLNGSGPKVNLNGDGQDDCYKVVPPGEPAGVTMRLTVPAGAIPGTVWTIGADSGFRWVPQGQQTPGCE